MEKEDLEKSQLSFLEAPTKMKALTVFTVIQCKELIFAVELRSTKTVGKQPKKTRASRRFHM